MSSVNAYKPHVFVLPEDDANRQIANGFTLDTKLNARAIQVLPVAGGWEKVVERFKGDYAVEMFKYVERRMVLLIDFDNQVDKRKHHVISKIPEDIKNRVFVLGVASRPEELKAAIGKTFEAIGKTLAEECANDKQTDWKHDLLRHNESELSRLIEDVRPFLFNLA